MLVKNDEKYTEIRFSDGIALGLTLDCGQAFRWTVLPDGGARGVVRGRDVRIEPVAGKKDTYLFRGIDDSDFADFFFDYFDMGRDYRDVLATVRRDEVLRAAADRYGTVRILNQEPWEALASFIFSSCNNITRIKGIIERFCRLFGERAGEGYAFPTAVRTAELCLEDLEPLRAGYRAPYILDAARRVAGGETDLLSLYEKPLPEAEKELCEIKGVGKKVADCVLLFSLRHSEAFPVDRHIKRFCEANYPDGLPAYYEGIQGIAQQYMFLAQRQI